MKHRSKNTEERAERRSSRPPLADRSGTFDRGAAPAWRALADALAAPIHHPELDARVGAGELDYEVYVRSQELLGLQTPPEQLVHPDELLFQITHQAQELWLKLLGHEAVRFVAALDDDRLDDARFSVERMRRALVAMVDEIRVLETLTPAAFQVIRRSLGQGSGLQSPGFAGFKLAAAPALAAALTRALTRRGLDLDALYGDDRRDPPMLGLCEQLLDLDEAFQLWLVVHFMLVRRTIGVDREVLALDGYPTKALEVRMKRALFPALWDVRVRMTRSWSRDGGFAPGAAREPANDPGAPSSDAAALDAASGAASSDVASGVASGVEPAVVDSIDPAAVDTAVASDTAPED